MFAQAELKYDVDLPFRHPLGACRFDRRPGEAAISVDFTAFHRNTDRRAVRIAEHGLEFGAKHHVQKLWKNVAVSRGPGRAYRHFATRGVLDRCDAACVPGDAGGHVSAHAAEPGEFQCVVSCLVIAEQRLDRKVARGHTDHRAVALRDVVEIIHHHHAAGAWHVLGHDRRVSRNVPADVTSEEPHIKIIAGTDAVADEHPHLFILVEPRNR